MAEPGCPGKCLYDHFVANAGGLPNRCSICGGDFDLEPSLPTGDAPCPQCGHLLWWFQQKYEGLGFRIGTDTELIEQLKADSLDIVELAMELQDEFDVEFADEDYERIRTVGDAIRIIREQLGIYG